MAAAARLLAAFAAARELLNAENAAGVCGLGPPASPPAASPASPAAVARRRQERGELEAAARLIDSRDENDVAPLHLAAQHGHAHVAAALVEAGADVAARDDGGCTPLMEARIISAVLCIRFYVCARLFCAVGLHAFHGGAPAPAVRCFTLPHAGRQVV